MKYLITTIIAVALAAGSAYAGCNKKASSIGKLESFDAATKTLTIAISDSSNPKEVKSKMAKLTMTPDSAIVHDGQVNGVDASEIVGKKISVVSEHGKIDYVITLADV